MTEQPVHRRARALAAVVLAAVLCVGAGYGVGRYTDTPQRAGSPAPPSSSSDPGGSYEQRQRQVNASKLPAGDLGAFAAPWLTRATDCQAATEPNGPRLGEGESARIRCTMGVAGVYFVTYRTPADHDKARGRFLAQAVDARRLAPQVGIPTRRTTTSKNSTGNYAEYAYTVPSGERAGQVVAGVWWDSDRSPVAGYLVAYWDEGLGQSWDPIRDLWQRTS